MVRKRCPAKVISDVNEKPQEVKAAISHTVDALVTDFSVKGLGLSATQYVSPKTKITVHIFDKPNEYSVQAEIVWCYKMPSSGRVLKDETRPDFKWRMGLAFILRDPADLKLVEGLAHELSVQEQNY